ncbi:Echinoderm microtubule-associated protein-like CG42247 [Papilio machaon]|uniref:Echinoderm microtubule-associated protein-like CG42247 n=1 Tax=Papilio machaon TaxID=76193 RepID=A0A194QSG6_PAPMA|nr:Echinoderm microtubule-associated protein-like CG42247 [Papilio machaon]
MSRRQPAKPRLHSRNRPQAPEPVSAPEPTPAPEPEPQAPSDDEKESEWRPSRPPSPPQRNEDISEGSEATVRAVRPEPTSRYANLNYWKARRVTFYRNGDPFHPGVEFRFKPGRDLVSMDALLDRLSERLELPRGARFIFGMDGDRKYRLEELEDGASYVVSSYKTFKGPSRSERITFSKAGNASAIPLVLQMSMGVDEHLGVLAARGRGARLLGCVDWRATLSALSTFSRFAVVTFVTRVTFDGKVWRPSRRRWLQLAEDSMLDSDEESFTVISLPVYTPDPPAASYGKKNGMWYGGTGTGTSGWARASVRKQSVAESDAPPPGGGKPSSGRVIRIINNMDHSIQCRVLLNLRTTQPFEEVLEDLGQVLKMSGAKRMYTITGQEISDKDLLEAETVIVSQVRSFSQLRNEFADVETFYLGSVVVPPALSPIVTAPLPIESPIRRQVTVLALHMLTNHESRSRATVASLPISEDSRGRRARSKSRPRVLYAPEGEIIRNSDYTLLEVLKEEPMRVTIRGLRRTFYPPIHHAPIDNSPPDKKMQLDWVYGYRGADSRRNLWVLPTGELLYYVAAIAVMYDRDEDSQRHYTGHTEDIQCMELHPSRELVASGQRAGRGRRAQAHVRIWSADSLQTLHVCGMAEFEAGVSAVAFSQLNGGSYVLAVDAGRESILSVWQWQWGHLLGKVATLQEELTGAAFHPLDDNLLITHGKGHLAFWNRRKDGFFERTDIIKPPSRTNVTALQFEQDGDVVTADSDGFITVYSVDSDGAYFVRMEFEAHIKGISSLVMLSEGTLISGGEKDRKIAAWDSLQNYKRITETKLPETAGGVRSIYPQRPGRNDGNLYIGTTKNNILEGSLQRRFNQIIFGHHKLLMGMAVHPDDEMFATAGNDKNIALWKGHKPIFVTQVGYECVSLAWHPSGGALAAGSTEGHLVVLNADAGSHVATLRVCGSPLNCLQYNTAGDTLAIGSQNGSIYLFRVSRDGFSYKKLNKIRGAQPLVQLDWSMDGNYLQTVTADYDLSFWDIKALSPEKSPIAMKDVKWSTYNATVGFLVSGMWNNRFYPMTSLITTASRSSAHDLLISGDSDGYLRIFRYPCASPKAEYNEVKVYSGAVHNARFLFNDRCLISTGGSDAALMLWELVDE